MSYSLKDFLSQESIDDTDVVDSELTEEENDELQEAVEETDAIHRDIEAARSDAERLDAVGEQLAIQEEVADKIAEQNDGKLPEDAAAMLETSRRVAVAAVGVDPDSEEGQELVSVESIQSRFDGTWLSMEEEAKKTGLMSRIKESIKKIWEWIKEKISALIEWISKATNIIPKRLKTHYNAIKSMSDDDFKAKINSLDDDTTSPIIQNGKIGDLGKLTDEVTNYVTGGFTSLLMIREQGPEHFSQTGNGVLKDVVFKAFEGRWEKFSVVINGEKYSFASKDEPYSLKHESVEQGRIKDITRSELLNALNQGISTRNKINALAEKGKASSNKAGDKLSKDDTALGKELSNIAKNLTFTYSVLSKALLDHQRSLLKLAGRLAPRKPKKNKKTENQE